jgi:hypothetical protein
MLGGRLLKATLFLEKDEKKRVVQWSWVDDQRSPRTQRKSHDSHLEELYKLKRDQRAGRWKKRCSVAGSWSLNT